MSALPARRPVSFAVVTPPTGGGGMELTLATLFQSLDRSAISPSLVLTHSRAANMRLLARIPSDVPVFELDKRGKRDHPRVVRALVQLFNRSRPDVVMGLNTYANVISLLARRFAGHRPGVIASEHASPLPLRSPRFVWLLWPARKLYPAADSVLTVGEGMADAVADTFRLPRRRVMVINPAYQPELDEMRAPHASPQPPLPSGSPVALYVGRLSPEKGIEDLLAAIALLRNEIPVRLAVVGDGPLEGALRMLVGKLEIDDLVSFMGYVERPFAHMRAADVLVVPSHSDAFPVVVAEGMRSGAAVVATGGDFGPREMISDGHDGLLVPAGDPAAIAGALRRVFREPGLAQRLRERARLSSERYAPRRMVDAYERLILEVADRRAAEGSGGRIDA